MSGTSYTVSARLQITGNAEQVLRALGRQITSLNTSIRTTQTSINRLATSLAALGTHLRPLEATTRAFIDLRTAIRGVSTTAAGATRSIERQGNIMLANARAASTMQRAAQQAQQAMAGLGNTGVQRIRPVSVVQAGGAGYTPLWRRTGGVGAAVGGAAGAVLGRNPLTYGAAGYLGFRAVGEVIEQGGSLQQEMAAARAAGLSPAYIERLRARAAETTDLVPGTDIAQNFRAAREALTQIGGEDDPAAQENAIRLLPMIQRIARATSLARQRPNDEGFSGQIAKALNQRGAMGSQTNASEIDLARYEREANELLLNLVANPGLDPRQIVNFFLQGRTSAQQLSSQFMWGGSAASGITSMTGNRFGTALQSFTRQFARGVMTRAGARVLMELGLITPSARGARLTREELESMRSEMDPEEFENLARGDALRFSREHLVGADLAMSDPEAWRRVILGRLQGRRFRGGPIDTNNQRTLDMLATAMGNTSVTQGFLSWLFDFRGREPDIRARQRVDPNAAGILINESFQGGLAAMAGGWRAFLQSLGESDAVVKLMHDMGRTFRELGDAVRDTAYMDGFIERLRTLGAEMVNFARALNDVVTSIQSGIQRLRAIGETLGLISRSPPDPNFIGPPAPSNLLRSDTPLGRYIEQNRRRSDAVIQSSPDQMIPPAEAPGSWGGPDPRNPRGGIQLNSFERPGGGRGDTVVQTSVYLDGREIADVISRHQGQAAQAPTSAAPRFDSRRAPLLPDGMATA